jgi:ribonuclease-3 family protein
MEENKIPISVERANRISPVTLAFLGDAVYSTKVRTKLVLSGKGKPADLQKTAGKIVSAQGQSAFLREIENRLTEEELEVFKRGRNAKKGTKAKSASVADYNRSTGFEAVVGFLFLTGRNERIDELIAFGEAQYEIERVKEVFKP